MKLNIINGHIYIKGNEICVGSILNLKLFNENKKIVVKDILIKDDSVIISTNDKNFINLSKINPNNILNIENSCNNKNLVYLGGTCSGYDWRSLIISNKFVFYNPLKHNWNNKTFLEEQNYRQISRYNIYVFTKEI